MESVRQPVLYLTRYDLPMSWINKPVFAIRHVGAGANLVDTRRQRVKIALRSVGAG